MTRQQKIEKFREYIPESRFAELFSSDSGVYIPRYPAIHYFLIFANHDFADALKWALEVIDIPGPNQQGAGI